ncbi:uncharacterized protein LOC134699040 [Mytilus trossulus]|uniref:uncharacterized protein LOC134699040 n=1 Tax=Mytilus trossulus TaxID=6551 RepID=UPI003005346E
MSLSAQNRKIVWEEHKDSLRRIQSRVSDGHTPPNRYSPQRGTPPGRYNRSPQEGGRRSHSPYGKYRKPTSPAYLNRIETPHERDRVRNKGNLRGSKYGVVPPVHRRSHQTPDYDSWGEDTDDDSGEEQQYVMPQQYPYPAYGYPAYQHPQGHHGPPQGHHAPPPQVVWGAPFQIYYPPPPQHGYKSKKARDKRAKRAQEKQPNVHHSQPHGGRQSRYQKSPRVNHSLPVYNGYGQEHHQTRRRDEVFDSDRNDVLKKYKYIETQPSPYTPENIDDMVAKRYKDEPELLSLFYYNDHPLFAEGFVNWFINDCLEEIIPDLLIETLNDLNKLPRNHPYYDKAQIICNQILEEVLPDVTHEAVRQAMSELVGDYMGFSQQKPTADRINELVAGAAPVGQEDVSESFNTVLDDLIQDHIEEIQQELINDVITDAVIEQIIEEDILVQEVDEEAPEIAEEVLSQYDSKIERRELKEVAKQAGDKLQESILLDYILSMVASQGRVWSQSDHANKYLDDILLDLLIEQFYTVQDHREKTSSNNPLRKLHEKVTTDVAVDLLLQQLTSSLDEDLADVDEYERGVDDVKNTIKTPIIPRTIQKY